MNPKQISQDDLVRALPFDSISSFALRQYASQMRHSITSNKRRYERCDIGG